MREVVARVIRGAQMGASSDGGQLLEVRLLVVRTQDSCMTSAEFQKSSRRVC